MSACLSFGHVATPTTVGGSCSSTHDPLNLVDNPRELVQGLARTVFGRRGDDGGKKRWKVDEDSGRRTKGGPSQESLRLEGDGIGSLRLRNVAVRGSSLLRWKKTCCLRVTTLLPPRKHLPNRPRRRNPTFQEKKPPSTTLRDRITHAPRHRVHNHLTTHVCQTCKQNSPKICLHPRRVLPFNHSVRSETSSGSIDGLGPNAMENEWKRRAGVSSLPLGRWWDAPRRTCRQGRATHPRRVRRRLRWSSTVPSSRTNTCVRQTIAKARPGAQLRRLCVVEIHHERRNSQVFHRTHAVERGEEAHLRVAMAELRRWRMPPLDGQSVGKGIEDPPGWNGSKNVGGNSTAETQATKTRRRRVPHRRDADATTNVQTARRNREAKAERKETCRKRRPQRSVRISSSRWVLNRPGSLSRARSACLSIREKGVRRTNPAVDVEESNALRRFRADLCVREPTRLARLRRRNAGNWPSPRFAAC